jgi:flagellar basal-body rod modification protein FlgD
MSIATNFATQQSAAAAAATPAPGSAPATGSGALTSLASNFQTFLSMLMTQLKNQDPTSPMDSNQFTSELVQFSSVEQQINTNTSLTQLIQLTQAGELMQSSAMVGKQVEVNASDLSLQNGHAAIRFTAPAGEPALISVTTDTGVRVLYTSVAANSGSNTWTWDGRNASGRTMPDGTYQVTVTGQNADGTASALKYTVLGTATAVQSPSKGTLALQLGALAVPFSEVVSVN